MLKGWVLDVSLALAWVLPDEGACTATRFFEETALADVRVPALFWYEIASATAAAEKRGRLTMADAKYVLDLFAHLPLKTDSEVGQPSLSPLASTARTHSLSVYDASYLDLAARKGLGLATIDDRLAAAARKAGIAVFP